MEGTARGFTLIEILIALTIGTLVMVALGGVVGQALQIREATRERLELDRQARFAMERMVSAVRGTSRLLLPLAENPATAWSESVRDPGVLAVSLDPTIDRDRDGVADADNDGDGKVDEDLPSDMNNDGASGIVGFDDDNDGLVDESNRDDDDEDEDTASTRDEDPANGLDDDGDGAVDEDCGADMNGDLEAGVRAVDDDGDGLTDESSKDDDDEDKDDTGDEDEDWLDPVVFYLNGTILTERYPVRWDENKDGDIDGLDFLGNPIAENVTLFRVERLSQGAGRAALVEITLSLKGSGGESLTLREKVRAGGK